jgi:AcrR family transcriptional regulator
MIEPVSDSHRSGRPGPRRPAGSPAGPDEVRRAVPDAAAALVAVPGAAAVSLRDVAAAAGVNLSLTGRHIGRRDELVAAMSGHVRDQLAQAVEENPLPGQGFSPDTVTGPDRRRAGDLWPLSGEPPRLQPRRGDGRDPDGRVGLGRRGGPVAGGADRGGHAGLADLRGLSRAGWRPGGDPAGDVAGRTGAFRACWAPPPGPRRPVIPPEEPPDPSGAWPEDRGLRP